MRVLLCCLAAVITMTAQAQTFSLKKGGHSYTLEIPDYMTRTFSLNDVASLQYMNSTKEAYVIVIDDEKELLESLGQKFTNAEDFLYHFLKTYNKDAEDRKTGEISSFLANGNAHSQVTMTWKNDELSFFMIITTVESRTHFYKILTWTLAENRDLLRKDFLKIAKSLRD